MDVEFIFLGVLIIIFIASFCGLLQKIRKTYEDDREYTARVTNASSPQMSYTNPSFVPDANSNGVYPSAPPPYADEYNDPPPKYEDLIKDESFRINIPTTTASN